MWKDVVGFECEYSVSDTGEIICKRTGEISKTCKDKVTGYEKVNIYSNGKNNARYVHRLVAEAFMSNESNKPQVHHINGDKMDNRVENLKWCTIKEHAHMDIERRKTCPSKSYSMCVKV